MKKLRRLLTQTSNRCHIIILQRMIIFLILKAIQILIFIVIFLLLTQNISIQKKFVKVLNVFVKTVSALHVKIRSILKYTGGKHICAENSIHKFKYCRVTKNILFSVMHRPPNGDMTVFGKFCENLLSANDKNIEKHYFC